MRSHTGSREICAVLCVDTSKFGRSARLEHQRLDDELKLQGPGGGAAMRSLSDLDMDDRIREQAGGAVGPKWKQIEV